MVNVWGGECLGGERLTIAIPWVRCASGNVLPTFCIVLSNLACEGTIKKLILEKVHPRVLFANGATTPPHKMLS